MNDIATLITDILDADAETRVVDTAKPDTYLEASEKHMALSKKLYKEGKVMESEAYGRVGKSYEVIYKTLKR